MIKAPLYSIKVVNLHLHSMWLVQFRVEVVQVFEVVRESSLLLLGKYCSVIYAGESFSQLDIALREKVCNFSL